MRRLNHRATDGFTIVEVIIAVLVITVVLAGAVYYIAGAGHSQERASNREKMAAFAEEVSSRMRADQAWLGECSATLKQGGACNLGADSAFMRSLRTSKTDGDIVMNATVVVDPIDSETDKLGPDDTDGQTIDFYRVKIHVEMTQSGQAMPALDTTTTLDAATLGLASGTLVLDLCEVTDQVDQRMPIGSCGTGTAVAAYAMARQPEPCASSPVLELDQNDNSMPITRPLPFRCNAAIDQVSGSRNATVKARGSVHVRHVPRNDPTRVSLTWDDTSRAAGGTRPHDRTLADADWDPVSGTYMFRNLAAGRWKITVSTTRNRERWREASIPSGDFLSVAANQKVHALAMLRPKQAGTYTVDFSRDIYKFHITQEIVPRSYTQQVGRNGTVYGSISGTWYYHYLVLDGPQPNRVEHVPGASWDAILGMEAKPYERYRFDDRVELRGANRQVPQYFWKAMTGRGTHADPYNAGTNSITFGTEGGAKLPTGLMSLPQEAHLPTPLHNYWGYLQGSADGTSGGADWSRRQQCFNGRTCTSDAVWIAPDSSPTSKYEFYDRRTGECYVRANIHDGATGNSFVIEPNTLNDGFSHATRCNRTLEWNFMGRHHTAPGFFPRRNKTGGTRRVLWFISMEASCAQTGVAADGSVSTCSMNNSRGISDGGTHPDPPPVAQGHFHHHGSDGSDDDFPIGFYAGGSCDNC